MRRWESLKYAQLATHLDKQQSCNERDKWRNYEIEVQYVKNI